MSWFYGWIWQALLCVRVRFGPGLESVCHKWIILKKTRSEKCNSNNILPLWYCLMFSAAGQLWYFLMKDVIFFLTAIFFACFFLSLWLLWFISLMLQDPSLLWSFLPFFFPPICVTRCLAASMLAAVVVLSGTLSGNRILVTGGALDGNPLLHRKTLQRQKSPRCFLVAFCSSPATASLAYLLQVDPVVFPWAGSRSWSWGCCERDGMEASGVGLVGLVCSWGVFLAPEPACFAVLLLFFLLTANF